MFTIKPQFPFHLSSQSRGVYLILSAYSSYVWLYVFLNTLLSEKQQWTAASNATVHCTFCGSKP